MQLTTTLLSLATMASLVSACLTFDGTLSTQIPRKITGKLIDNGNTVCTIDNYIDQASISSAWAAFKCKAGYTAWIQTDGSRIGYFNGAHNYEFAVVEGKTGGLGKIGGQTKELWAKNYGC